ncbi:hypothetical protein FZI91_09225 [Mycobacterium sp. CBMA271]|uniref:hypothetical protein n=1 Tax=unclassified Mycobacteroides TaxID=2618759 RepID=UPI0012DE60E5|nr:MULTISPECIES: hypothetical protein [unclassified Mycobacteroides]MUM15613.1 hypothetical protein [Mycobacteroides sp. CBMA 326]MUM17408.1 hypothetical protein [Mycobacteroides sp. CBMA 326]MUM21883.1 hypothetical protein [Mycobacteroides sp. CBMA 271]
MLLLLALIGGAIWLVVHLSNQGSRNAQARRAIAHHQWAHAVQVCAYDPRFQLAYIAAIIESYPNKGTKAWVTWYGSNVQQDAWIPLAWPMPGNWLVVSGSTGYGPHHDNPNTFFVEQVHDIIAF